MPLAIDKRHARQILHLASPAIMGLSAQVVVSLVITAMVGRLANTEVQLAAMGLGLLGTWAITSFFSSLSTGTHVLVARRHGEANDIGAGDVLNNSLAICLVCGALFGLLGYFFSFEIIDLFSREDAVTHAGAAYMRYQFLGLPFFLLIVSYRGFFFGIGHTNIFMASAIIINVFNIIFSYLFIFGAFGFPRMDLAGAGIGSSISMALGWLFFLAVTFLGRYRKQYKYYSHFSLSKDVIAQIVNISMPVSLQNILILLGFLIFVAITGIIGVVEQAASNVVINALFISLMPCFGFGIAAQTLIGQSIGRGSEDLAHAYGVETAKMATLFTLVVGICFVAAPDAILTLLTTQQEVIEAARPLLRVAGIAQIFYGSGIIFAHGLQAGGATVYVMMVEVVTHWIIFLPLTYLFGVTFGGGVLGAWLALPVYIVAYSASNYKKFRSSSWMNLKL